MSIRRVLHELEAKLSPAGPGPAASAKGKLEYKRYGDDRQRMKIKCRGLDLPEGTELELRAGATLVAVLEMRNGRADLDEERPASADAPPLAKGDRITLCHAGDTLLSGTLYLD